jgi:hypothetical protein
MDNDLPEHNRPPPAPPPLADTGVVRDGWFARRKRIVAREVTPLAPDSAAGAVAREMRSAALGELRPVDVIDIPRSHAGRPEAVLDPTLFSERHRKRGQNTAYRITQITAVLSLLTASAGIVVALLEEPILARTLAGTACGLGTLTVCLVRSSRLAYRLRGYAVAACAFAMISLVVSLLPMPGHDEVKPPTPEKLPMPTPGPS